MEESVETNVTGFLSREDVLIRPHRGILQGKGVVSISYLLTFRLHQSLGRSLLPVTPLGSRSDGVEFRTLVLTDTLVPVQ